MPELIFNVAAGAPPEYRLLADSLRGQAVAQDAVASLVEDELPETQPDRVFVVIGARDGLADAPEPQRARTILISPALPGTAEAEAVETIAARVAVTLHPNFAAARQMAASDLRAAHIQLGYEPAWDRLEVSATAPPVESIRPPGDVPYFDWLRALLAIHRGAVVLHERSLGIAPLVPGRHIFVASPERLEDIASALEQNPARRRQTAAEAHDFIARLLPMSVGASALLGHARVLVVQPID